MKQKQSEVLKELVAEHALNPEKTRNFMNNCFKNGYFEMKGDSIYNLLESPGSMFDDDGKSYRERLKRVSVALENHFNDFDKLRF